MSYGVEELLKQRAEIDAELRRHKSPITVMFTDLAGSTAYFDRRGDTAGVAWIEEHNQIVIPEVKEHNGTVVKTIGDSVMAYFEQPGPAAMAAIVIQQRLLAANEGKPLEDHMQVRVAMHQGLGYMRGGDIFGDVVNVAARIAKACLPAQILVSESVARTLEQAEGLELRAITSLQFHGKSAKETVYELMWTDEATYAQLRRRFPAKSSKRPEEEYGQGRYQILGELGRGSMGTVYKAYDRTIGRVVAMKTIPVEAEAKQREALVERLKQEARAAGTLDHPNIVTVFDVGEEGGVFYFTMQYLEGRTLDAVCEKRELLPLEKVLDIGQQICAGVGFAHQKGIIHRDLKPANLMLTGQGLVKVMDFGIAKLGDAGLTSAGMILGTPRYLSPEQASGGRVDHRSDIFAIGAILYELLTGEKAFAGETATTVVYQVLNVDPIPPKAIERTLPPVLDAILLRALAKQPQQRYQSCEELARVLEQLGAAHATQSLRTQRMPVLGREEAVTLPPPPSGRRRAALWTATALLVLGTAAFVAWERLQPPAQGPALVEPRAEKAPETTPALPAPAAGESQPSAADPGPTAPLAGKETVPEKPGEASPLIQPAVASSAETTDTPPATKPKTGRDARPQGRTEQLDPASVPRGRGMFSADDVPGLLSRAQRYAGRGEYDKAIVLYQEILSIQPSNGEARQGLQRAREARKAGR